MLRVVVPIGVLLAATGAAASPAAATPNTVDPFYAPPADYADATPGSILRIRPIQASYMQLIPMPVQAWQLLYRTTGADGQPYAAVTTVLRPAHATQPTAILSFQNMTDAIAPQCMPSQDLQQGAVPWFDPSKPGPIQLSTMANETPMIAAALARGWAVSVPDTGGIDNHFESPHEPGYVVLDGIRAAENFAPAGLPGPGTRAVLWGYSGGAITSAWAAQEQPHYAPELNLAGAALGGPVGDMGTGIRAANGTPVGGALVPVAMMGMMQDSPEFTAALDRYLTPEGRQRIAAATNNCAPQNLLSNMGFDAGQFLTAPLDDVLADPVISAALRERNLGGAAPTVPLYVYNAIDDEGSAITGVDRMVSAYCDAGTAVTYRREQTDYPVSGHTGEWFAGAPAALAWLQQRAENPVEQTGCDIRSVPATIVDPAALDSLATGIIGGPIRVMLGY
ncbi:lipase family protein [Nocardia stercoris]|uniref:Lipase n=1 Tax=Nocardia stercoris TaxID=2483361 RepID=A0A3M2KWQ1_9NOCA|nr:lipase family protein [Nocardia stercoris]RMI29454.1 lipase [Nocardia stercoris]